jgi:hypothetical protein
MLLKRLLLAASFSVGAADFDGEAAASVSYTVEFQATWSATTHPGAYPAGAHFSSLIGGVHNDQVSFWIPGGLASPGIEQMAEVGGVTLLRGEVQAAISAGASSSVIQGSGVNSPGKTTIAFEVSPSFPLVTLVTMVAPTPDWFVGVHGLDLREGSGWRNQVTVDLFAYDAGTEEGVGFSLANPATVPPQPIALLSSPLSASDPPLGTLKFTRLSPSADFNGNFTVGGDDLLNWQGGFGAAGSAAKWQGDADVDFDADGFDFLAWQRQLGSGLATAALRAVPEPALTPWAAGALAALVVQTRRPQRRAAETSRLVRRRHVGGPPRPCHPAENSPYYGHHG